MTPHQETPHGTGTGGESPERTALPANTPREAEHEAGQTSHQDPTLAARQERPETREAPQTSAGHPPPPPSASRDLMRLKASIAQAIYEAQWEYDAPRGWHLPWAEASEASRDRSWRIADG